MKTGPAPGADTPPLAIALILIGMLSISINDTLIKLLSGGYALHQLVFIRSALGLAVAFVILRTEGGLAELRTATPGLHLVRALLIVAANMLFFAALAIMPLADATALFFVAPLCITVMSVLFLGESVGPHRVGAIVFGFLGVVVMMRPGVEWDASVPRAALLLPVLAAVAYSGMQILTRKLGATSKASALAIYIQGTFLLVGAGFYLVAGDGRFAEGIDSDSLQFLLRAWIVPPREDWLLLVVLGLNSGLLGYVLSQAYRLGNAATISTYEYTALPLAILWGWVVFGDFPDVWVLAGTLMIAGSGLYVFARERRRAEAAGPARTPARR